MPDVLMDGEVVAEGEFTLDRARAQEKMRRYSLPDPHRYVLELVKAAVLQGARAIEFEMDADDVRMRFDGPPFPREDLAAAEAAALTGTGALAHLGMGLAAAMALKPRFVRCESGGVRLELRPRRPDRLETAETAAGTALHVRDRPHPRHVLEFLRSLAGWTTEGAVLQQHARFSPVPIRLNGRALTEDWREFVPLGRVPVGDAGVAGFTAGGRAELLIVKDGVLMETVALEPTHLPYRVLLHARGLSENVSHNGLVRDAAFAAVLKAAQDARPSAVAALCRDVRGRLDEFTWAVRDLRLEVLACKTPEAVPPDLASLRLWDTATGDLVRLSLEEILRWIEERGDIPYALETHPGLRLDGMPRVLLAHSGFNFDELKALLGHRARNVTRRIRNLQKREINRTLWRARPAEPTLDDRRFPSRRTLQADGLRGEVGLGLLNRRPLVRFLVDGCALPEFRPDVSLDGLEAVVSGDFTPSENFDAVRRDERWARALVEVARHLPDLYGAMRDAGPLVLRGPLQVLGDPDFPLGFLRACGCPEALARSLATPAPLPDDHPLAQVECFSDGSGRLVSLRELRRRVPPGERLQLPTPGRGIRLTGQELQARARLSQPVPEDVGTPLTDALERHLAALFRGHPSLPKPVVRLLPEDGEAAVQYVLGEFRLRRDHPLVAVGGEDPVLVGLLASLCLSALRLPRREEAALQEALAELALTGPCPEPERFEGALEEVRSDGAIRGWARDPEDPARTLEVRLFLDGRILVGTAPAGPEFRFQLPPEHLDGSRRVLSAAVEGQEVAASAFTAAAQIPTPPVGRIERVDADGVAVGWTLDPNSPGAGIGVHFYLDGPAGQGEFIGGVGTGIPRPDVNKDTGYSGDHGFRFQIPAEHLDGSEHELWAYGIDAQGGHNPLLDGGPLRFT